MEYDWRRNMWMIVLGAIVVGICIMSAGCKSLTQQREENNLWLIPQQMQL